MYLSSEDFINIWFYLVSCSALGLMMVTAMIYYHFKK
ncbi:hypothetical protein AMBR_MGDJBKAP_01974 [Leuconostoc pseudomesenteroides]|jgi:hypothetical protein|nr:hypothetical protein AMBR_MGDJBKAP_01974 [Leuconostoc pseudomesenteroides]